MRWKRAAFAAGLASCLLAGAAGAEGVSIGETIDPNRSFCGSLKCWITQSRWRRDASPFKAGPTFMPKPFA